MKYLFNKKVSLSLLAVCLILGSFTAGALSSSPPDTTAYPLLSKRINNGLPDNPRINFSGLRSALRSYFEDNTINGSVYFEYLPTGTSVRVNGDERYRAASLIKLPVAMELYKAVELDLVSLSDTVTLKQEWLNDGYGELYKKGAGYQLTLGEAVKIMLEDSDNTALRAIIEATQNLELKDRALSALDIEFTAADDGSIDIGTRSYSSFLKCLYYGCYNSLDDSQTILELLTMTSFDNRLIAGIDDNSVVVAHKIGVFNTQIQSDCGIIYLNDDDRYVLCVMLTGDDTPETNSKIADISRIVYQYMLNN